MALNAADYPIPLKIYGNANMLLQKRKGRQMGKGSRKGKRTARLSDKEAWINKVRLQRGYLRRLKSKGYVSTKDFRLVYRKIGGGFFRNKRHVRMYLEENKLLRKNDTEKKERRKNRL